jgi:hypothetical protein
MYVAIPPSANGTPTLAHPAGHLAWELGITGAALVLLGLGLLRARSRQSPRLLLMVLGAASASWQETYGDWGAYVRYSDRFVQFGWPSHLWVASVRCWWFIAGYAVFYPALYGLLTLATGLVRRRLPRQNLYVAAVLLAFPVFYVFDLLFEGTATYLGYWRYLHAFGPALHLGSSSFPLVWPILEQVPFIALAAVAIVWRDGHGQDVFERIASRLSSRPQTGTLIAVWVLTTNAAFLVTTTLPIMALRWIAGPDLSV